MPMSSHDAYSIQEQDHVLLTLPLAAHILVRALLLLSISLSFGLIPFLYMLTIPVPFADFIFAQSGALSAAWQAYSHACNFHEH